MELKICNILLLIALTTCLNCVNGLSRKRVNELLNKKHENVNKLAESGDVIPGKNVASFSLYTLNGIFKYPGPIINQSTPLIFTLYNEKSAFMQCLLNSSESVEKLLIHSPSNTHYIFLSTSNAEANAKWMKSRFDQVALELRRNAIVEERWELILQLNDIPSRLHFVTLPLDELGNWIPSVLKQWTCSDHNCGLDQVLMKSDVAAVSEKLPLVLPRLDARYDWLPSPASVFGNSPQMLIYVGDGCDVVKLDPNVTVLVSADGCYYFDKIKNMEKQGAKGVIIIAPPDGIRDMNCAGDECLEGISIPATMISHDSRLDQFKEGTVTFQNTPSDNFFMAIDYGGHLAEVGWFLYPSFYFHVWQAQWFDYMNKLNSHLSEKAHIVNIFKRTVMQGSKGAVANVKLNMGELSQFTGLELHASLSCPGDRDITCPHWDHTVQLFVSCTHQSVEYEFGRWISPFRRRIGQWITDVSPLIPLLGQGDCTFTMKTVPWAMAWTPSLNLRFTAPKTNDITAREVTLVYQGSFTFDKNYNSHFKPYTFKIVPTAVKKVLLVTVITGHGSDENQCGEFCNTTHTVTINGKAHTQVNDISGTPLGCALKVPLGVVPNEHGTWLYGRDGWCDGQPIQPWIVDITKDLVRSEHYFDHVNSLFNSVLRFEPSASENLLKYHGYFNGKDPDPKQNPGNMIVTMYLVYYW